MDYYTLMCERTGYEPITEYWKDFSVAELFGEDRVQKLYKRTFSKAKKNYKLFTELVMILNWKCWYWDTYMNPDLSRLYAELYYEADEYGLNHFKDDELTYFWRTLD